VVQSFAKSAVRRGLQCRRRTSGRDDRAGSG
jgi:hypothetical protein